VVLLVVQVVLVLLDLQVLQVLQVLKGRLAHHQDLLGRMLQPLQPRQV
jgi:hypothetical protein